MNSFLPQERQISEMKLLTFNNADQDSLNSAAGGNHLERRTQDVLTIIKNKSKVRNSRNKSIVSQVKSSDVNSSSSSEISKLTHAVNQQTSVVTTTMTAILKQFQATPPSASVKVVEEIYVTYGGAHPYYQCLAADGNTFLEFQDNIQGYVSAAAVKYNQGNFGYRPLSVANKFDHQKSITTRSGLVLDGTPEPMPPPFINPEEDERIEETLTDPKLAEYTIKVPPPFVQKSKPPSQINYVQEKDEIQVHKFWQMFKQLHINITLADALILIPKYQTMLKALISNKEKLLKLANTPLNENCSAVILKKLPEKLGDPGKFLISCGFSELKCKALADLGASINLMSLSIWKKLGLPELISTRMTLELANRAICTSAGIARDVFVSVGKFTFPADFVIIDYGSDPRVPSSWEDLSYGPLDYLEDLFATNHLSGNPTFSSHTDLTSPEVINPLCGNTTSFSPDHLLEEFADELALITFPPRNDDFPFDIESDLREIEYLLNHDLTKEMDSILEDSVDECDLADPDNDLVDTIPEMFTDEHTRDYSSLPLYDDVDDDLVELESNNDDVYDDPFDSKEDKIKESKLLIDELDPPRSSDFLPSPEYESVLYEDFSEVDDLPSTNNEDKVFNPSILIHENLSEVTIRVTPDKNVKKISISNASLILEDFNPPLYELPFHKEVLSRRFFQEGKAMGKRLRCGSKEYKFDGHPSVIMGFLRNKDGIRPHIRSKMSFHQVLDLIFELDEMKLTTGRVTDGLSCGETDMVIKDLDLEPKDVITEFYAPSRWKELSKETSSKILPCGDGSCWKTFKLVASLIVKGKIDINACAFFLYLQHQGLILRQLRFDAIVKVLAPLLVRYDDVARNCDTVSRHCMQNSLRNLV
uniref:Reverse transcriptase domain-containing protein n=1 Tax=Tanacetum cinerariifolium TaxID=118510 RepID=A0A6L2K1N5_TANCI|nr:reverse transcriptase domain-containing protein [Tanacetum cinerariifolium]